ncbi:MAG: potassium transporter Trk [Rubrivivax sp. SCN 71-131]|jgi:trk system potassium uptake protein TrkH|nr:MAG: potassium transporter Trk [Rubrivivax sp. SCN 71-131]
MGALAVVAMVGRLVVLFALFMGVPLAFAAAADDAARDPFLAAAAITLTSGLAMSLATRRFRRELQPRDGFLLVGLTWALLPLFGALPLLLAIPGLGFTDAYFEAMSGFTTTGATVLSGLDALPTSVNVWRCLLSLIGGMGIIILAVAILPLLGVGGNQLVKTEMTGPMKDQKLTPRIADTARAVWVIYAVIALVCTLAYQMAGMSWSDAFMHMCTTVSLGGFSSHDASFGYWDSPAIEAVAIAFMMLSGINLVLYFAAWRARSPAPVWRNTEARAYLGVLVATVALLTAFLWLQGSAPSAAAALRLAAFHVVSVATTTGYATYDYAQWPHFASMLMILLGCFATCAGSTGGGMKMVRVLLLLKLSRREMLRILHPSAVTPVVLGGTVVSERVMHSVVAYMMMYGASLVALTLAMLFSGLEPVTAFTAVLACLNNIGPGLGEVGPALNYGGLSGVQLWICTLAMMLGRLELLAVLVLLTPQFWRK